MSLSRRSKNSMPNAKPTDDGRNPSLPRELLCSIAGRRRLKNDADTITPEAKPVSARCILVPIESLRKKTHAAPRLVPANGISIPCIIDE